MKGILIERKMFSSNLLKNQQTNNNSGIKPDRPAVDGRGDLHKEEGRFEKDGFKYFVESYHSQSFLAHCCTILCYLDREIISRQKSKYQQPDIIKFCGGDQLKRGIFSTYFPFLCQP